MQVMAKRGGIVGCRKFLRSFTCGLAGFTKVFPLFRVSSSVAAKLNSHCAQAAMKMLAKRRPCRDWCRRLQTIYEWPIDEQGNMSKGSFLHPEVSCKPEVCQRCF